MRIVLTGGGTGGHIYPAVSVGQALREAEPGVELLFVGSSHGPEGMLAEAAGIDFEAVPSSPLTKSVSLANAISLMRLAVGVLRARRILARFAPDAVLGTGGYTTAAVLLAAHALHRPIAIHEQNAVPGKTNWWLARIADKVCVSAESSMEFFPSRKVVITGMPIRREFAQLPPKDQAARELGIEEGMFTLLAIGGSQGARRVNEVIAESVLLLCEGGTQVLHQVGERNVQDVIARLELLYGNSIDELPYYMKAYVDMPLAMAAADLVIGRSGAGTIAEVAAAGLPGILVPYPHHRDQHQKRNAEYLVERGAAVMCEEAVLTPQVLADTLKDLRSSPAKLSDMAAAAAALGKTDAAERVADVVLSLAATGRS